MAASNRSAASRWGWRILVTVSGLLTLNGIALYLFIVETQQEQTIGVLLAGFGALAFTVSLQGFRHGSRAARNASWVVVATLAAIGLHMIRGGRGDLVATYLGLAALALVGQLLARGDVEP